MHTSKYNGVSYNNRREKWIARITIDGEFVEAGGHEHERDAAKAVDMALIRRGKQPINILKPLNK